jgi:hypothetical protein
MHPFWFRAGFMIRIGRKFLDDMGETYEGREALQYLQLLLLLLDGGKFSRLLNLLSLRMVLAFFPSCTAFIVE